jgi:membrane associated rhomboid family serine protease
VKKTLSVTNLLILVNVLFYGYETIAGTAPGDRNLAGYFSTFVSGPQVNNAGLIALGALSGIAVLHGEWWRIVTGAFLHAFLLHIAMNMFALYQLGTYLESAIGRWRMLAIYTVSLFGAGYAVVFFAPYDVTVGASGAIYGLFGALIAIGVRLGARGRALIGQMVPVLAINLAFTFAVPQISKAGHVGGLISGFLAGLIFFAMRAQPRAPVVVDRATGVATEAELLEPETPHA